MEYFYQDMERKLLSMNYETIAFADIACGVSFILKCRFFREKPQFFKLLDLIQPANPNYVTLKDLRRCGLAHRFFNTFVNYVKYCDQEYGEGERNSFKVDDIFKAILF